MEKEVLDRMIVEFEEVNGRLVNLKEFILDKDKFEELDFLNRDLLIAQLKAMESYISVLSIRIGLNSPQPEEAISEKSEEVIVPEEA